MSQAKVILSVTEGSDQGQKFTFEEHDTFIVGRMEDCHICLPEDNYLSRRHFILEVNPPGMRIRDLGSLNGTYVNMEKIGGRGRHESPDEGVQREYPQVDLKHGDEIVVGDTHLSVKIDFPTAYREPVICQQCGKDVSLEAGVGLPGEYICEACRAKAAADPSKLISDFLREIEAQEQDKEQSLTFESDQNLKLPDYDYSRELGCGGFGCVYLVKHKQDNTTLALKVMLPKMAASQTSRKRFLREVKVSSSLKHPNIVEFVGFGSQGAIFYFLMKYYPEGSVTDLMSKYDGKLPVDVALPIFTSALEGLAYAHGKNYVHRDLKPPNLLLKKEGDQHIGLIADFGLAKNFTKVGFSGYNITGGGDTAGSIPFMPKEQVINFKYMKPVSDVWSMGATLYNMLTGVFPLNFPRGADPIQVILSSDPVPIRKRDSSIPRPIAEVIDRSLEINTKKRYQGAGEMLGALKEAWS
jgi:eukaryotic-like serine/threonine-protein kinase